MGCKLIKKITIGVICLITGLGIGLLISAENEQSSSQLNVYRTYRDSLEYYEKDSLKFTVLKTPYDFDTEVSIGGNLDSITSYVKKYYNKDVTIEEISSVAGITYFNDSMGCFVWSRDSNILVLTHELFHANFFTLNRARIELNEQTHEVYAYQLENLLKQFYNE